MVDVDIARQSFRVMVVEIARSILCECQCDNGDEHLYNNSMGGDSFSSKDGSVKEFEQEFKRQLGNVTTLEQVVEGVLCHRTFDAQLVLLNDKLRKVHSVFRGETNCGKEVIEEG
ncbi:hypothetical protein V6N13_095564 [Hibiscus sabdariffa]